MPQDNNERRALSQEELLKLEDLSRLIRGDILKMTKLADSGHPGGSMSSLEIYLAIFSIARNKPDNPWWPGRDRVIVSHGHTSPGVYSVLGRFGFFNIDEAIAHFRQAGSIFEGHVERLVPGVEWSTGNLGQGLSAGCGLALAANLQKKDFHVFVAMSDAEQAKGQVSEARRFASKFGLTNITVLIDYNNRQISGRADEIMPVNIKEDYEADSWKTVEVDGHKIEEIYQEIINSVEDKGAPIAIIAHTHIGNGVSFMLDDEQYHGRALTDEEYEKAMSELKLDADLTKYQAMRESFSDSMPEHDSILDRFEIDIDPGQPRTYGSEDMTDNRSAFGNAIFDLAMANNATAGKTPIAAFDCDLMDSVKLGNFAKENSSYFFECGVSEHNTAAVAGSLSSQGIVSFWADFGVFGVDEVYNQQRLNDINTVNIKVVTTHCGLDVGQDGRTHQCIDYVGTVRNLFGFKIIVPADPNQTDRVIRQAAAKKGNFLIAMGRSKLPVIVDLGGNPFFGNNYHFEYGKADKLREGDKAAIITMGSLVYRSIEAWEELKAKGVEVKVFNFSCPTKIDIDALSEAASTGLIITYEDHNVATGLGAEVAKTLILNQINCKLKMMGVDKYCTSGPAEDVIRYCHLDTQSLIKNVLDEI